jgi:hypothetical protein
MPCRWREGGLSEFAGRVRFRRSFGLPRRIDSDERIWLTFGGIHGAVSIWFNDKLLDEHPADSRPFEFEVTELLGERNNLVVEVESNDDQGGLWGEVALEIRCRAFLREVRARSSGCATRSLVVRGQVVGAEDSPPGQKASTPPLELYVISDRRTIAYATVSASSEGSLFQLQTEELPAEGGDEVRVQLIRGAVIWYETVCKIEFETGSTRAL